MDSKADKENFIVVYPNGTGGFRKHMLTWNAGTCCGYAMERQVDDVGFIRKLIKRIESRWRIDSKRIYVTGMSNGAMMSYRLACELSEKIAAIAPVAGMMNCDPHNAKSPVSVIAFHGTDDHHAPYNGGVGRKTVYPRIDKSIPETISFWVEHNRCSANPEAVKQGNVIQETYKNGFKGAEVILYTLQGGKHAWPGGRSGGYYGNIDEPTQEISATDLIWDFFSKHPKEA